MKSVNIKLRDILGCFHYILDAPRNRTMTLEWSAAKAKWGEELTPLLNHLTRSQKVHSIQQKHTHSKAAITSQQ